MRNKKNLVIFNRYSVISKGNFDLPILSVKCGKEYLCVVKENKFLDIYSLSGYHNEYYKCL